MCAALARRPLRARVRLPPRQRDEAADAAADAALLQRPQPHSVLSRLSASAPLRRLGAAPGRRRRRAPVVAPIRLADELTAFRSARPCTTRRRRGASRPARTSGQPRRTLARIRPRRRAGARAAAGERARRRRLLALTAGTAWRCSTRASGRARSRGARDARCRVSRTAAGPRPRRAARARRVGLVESLVVSSLDRVLLCAAGADAAPRLAERARSPSRSRRRRRPRA